MVQEIGEGRGHRVVVLGCDDDKSIGIGNDLIGLLEDLGCLGLVLVMVVGLLQEGQLDLIRVCKNNQGNLMINLNEWVYSSLQAIPNFQCYMHQFFNV